MYDLDEGKAQDPVHAPVWFILAAAQVDQEVMEVWDRLRAILTSDGVTLAEQLSAEIRERIEASQ